MIISTGNRKVFKRERDLVDSKKKEISHLEMINNQRKHSVDK